MSLSFPKIFILPLFFEIQELHELERQIGPGRHTYDVREADFVLSKTPKVGRIKQELRRRFDDDLPEGQGSQDEVTIKVVKPSWLADSTREGALLPHADYLLYETRRPQRASTSKQKIQATKESPSTIGSFTRTKADPSGSQKRPALLHETTSEHDVSNLPLLPEFCKPNYSCQRPTPMHSPNAIFIAKLREIERARVLGFDKSAGFTGDLAYGRAASSIASYPYELKYAKELARLPFCGPKIQLVFQQWKDTGRIDELEQINADPKLEVLELFYNIWGSAEKTARRFYDNGWRDLDDVTANGWEKLNRQQKVGLKYYDEFKQTISRAEVEAIGATILQHANQIREGFELVIVGGYRRGKSESGDVDVMLSHRDESATLNLINHLLDSLDASGHLTHSLTTSHANSDRGQEPAKVALKDPSRASHGFGSLDTALIVWQHPTWDSGEVKNPHPHRRVDILVTPWKTAGCAVLGWTGAKQFERDLRSYCADKGLRFDSTGVRRVSDEMWMDLEADETGGMAAKEKKVFEGLGLQWLEPEMRCTG